MTRSGWLLGGLVWALVACSPADDGRRILGRWEAESFKLSMGLGLPIGPTLDISPDQVRVPGTDIQVPIQKFRSEGQDTTLFFPVGVDLTFRFESPDRMFTDLPVVGPVYYRRVSSAVLSASSAPAPKAELPNMQAGAVSTASVPRSAASQVPATSVPVLSEEDEFRQVVRFAQAGDDDAALRALAVALASGWVNWFELDRESSLDRLKSDVRYQALMARWRPSEPSVEVNAKVTK